MILLLRFLGVTFGFFAVCQNGLIWMTCPQPAMVRSSLRVCLVVIVTLRTMPSLASTWHNVLGCASNCARSAREPGEKKIVDTYLPVYLPADRGR